MARIIPRMLQALARHAPEAAAIAFEGTTWTRAELQDFAARVAGALRAGGVRRDDRVAVYLDKSPEAVGTLLGVMMADAICVPLDPTGPAPRLAAILKDCEPSMLVSSANKAKRLEALAAEGCELPPVLVTGGVPLALSAEARGIAPVMLEPQDETKDKARGEAAAPPPSQVIDEDLAYILYTSGSTGKPKGVMISHRAIVAFSDWAGEYFALHAQDRVASHSPLHFDLSLFDVWTTLAHGACVHLVPQGISFMATDLVRFIAESRVTVWQSVPSVLRMITRQLGDPGPEYDQLRLIFFAGEPYPPAELRELMSRLPNARYHNIYGATEINDVTCHTLTGLPDDGPLPIGVPCAHMEVLVLGEEGEVLSAQGAVGELCARGPTLARGYWGDPAMTAAKFVQDPRHDLYPDPLYRTGDLVRIGEGGTLHYVGRRDAQVKIRGFRVNIGEVEEALLRHDAISEVAVIDELDADGNRTLAACFIAHREVPDARTLKRHCLAFLPNYMVPERFVPVDTLPRTSTGKIDRQALRRQQEAMAQPA
ncbi:amino acid adenylation domain-containing protein [Stappia sp. 28M-7]|uniref:amino acid adenylation domain-containing protein n=1 Tax=Stappia sp. 28M-7 TaxID=2762596 RepID=UPI00163CC6D2|nr:amino acid adenylation domain-containing protein [Stappia sp. 28M-7]MBC2859194.1 amino acid adenylation domain-containing protein [Stappia sp. 28M-7]